MIFFSFLFLHHAHTSSRATSSKLFLVFLLFVLLSSMTRFDTLESVGVYVLSPLSLSRLFWVQLQKLCKCVEGR